MNPQDVCSHDKVLSVAVRITNVWNVSLTCWDCGRSELLPQSWWFPMFGSLTSGRSEIMVRDDVPPVTVIQHIVNNMSQAFKYQNWFDLT